MKILLIGGTGHIGKFLVPRLVHRGYQVVVASRGGTAIPNTPVWEKIEKQTATYARQDTDWYDFVAKTNAEVVIDIIGVDVPGTYEAAGNSCQHYIACGSVWMFGPPKVVPTPETTQGPCEFPGYASRYKELLATKKAAIQNRIAFTAIMPPNICGPGKSPLDGYGSRDLDIHRAHEQGKAVKLPAGCNTLISPCDANDIAQAFELAVAKRDAAADQIFNVGPAYALPAPQFIQAYARIYETDIPIEFVSQKEYYSVVLPAVGAHYHFREHMFHDISKIRATLGYEPKYTPEETMRRAVEWMREEKLI